jgi:superfamily II DNA or RNA helicase
MSARAILWALRDQPGIVLADEVGMGKTYIALAVVASVLETRGRKGPPVVVMLPPGLVAKWQREWKQFQRTCCQPGSLDWVRDEYAYEPIRFLRLVGGGGKADLVWMTTNCFNRERRDPWIELAIVRWARESMRLDEETKRSIYKWAAPLVRKGPRSGLSEDVMQRLLESPHERWREILIREGVLAESDEPPLPEVVAKAKVDGSHWADLRDFLRNEVPGRRGRPADETVANVGHRLRQLCREILPELLAQVSWSSPLLVLDEAHHAKNDQTKLARLFRSQEFVENGGSIRPRLADRFDRMLFLTATPFQLGHGELIRMLRSFASIRWRGGTAPSRSQEEFFDDIRTLEVRLSDSRAAARSLDHTWGRLTWDAIDGTPEPNGSGCDESLEAWWRRVEKAPATHLENDLLETVCRCRETRDTAQEDKNRPWAAIRTWVLRNNRPIYLPGPPPGPRRILKVGRSVAPGHEDPAGLPLAPGTALPFFLAARAQGELAAASDEIAVFAQGLASSYESFHHTRRLQPGETVMDSEDAENVSGRDAPVSARPPVPPSPGVPVEWYVEQIRRHVPDRNSAPDERYRHPKVSCTVDRAVDLWARGEKVLVFCFYRQTVRALGEHIGHAIQRRTVELVAKKLGIGATDAERWLFRAERNIARKDSLLRQQLEDVLTAMVRDAQYETLRTHEPKVIKWLSGYVRSPSFLARIMPLDRPELRLAFEEGHTNLADFRRAAQVFREAIETQTDASGLSFPTRVREFLDFAAELAERTSFATRDAGDDVDEAVDPLTEYFNGVEGNARGRVDADRADTAITVATAEGRRPRISDVVRIAHGETPRNTRERLMWAFNSPIFPEVLVSSRILGEGVDLHRFCRHVIHHDLDWNPSILEQRTGRVDRIRCKAELSGRPIEIYQPFLAGGADEKMFRVVKDRERWFQIVMGQEYRLDEATTEKLARRVPLPAKLANELLFRLAPE